MNRKYAFSMPELLIVFVLMAVLIVVSLYTINDRFTDFFTRYYSAYDALNKATYNTYTDTYCRVSGVSSDGKTDCERESTGSVNYTTTGRPFPDTAQKLCKRLTEYLNATDDNACSKAKKTIKNANDNEFNDESLQFSLTNGFRFYFSEPSKVAVKHAGIKNKTIQYYIVYIDLNGKSAPNSFGLPHPDIVPFIVTFTGDVIPVGYPVYDKTYVSARVIDNIGKQTKSYTLDEARQIAFGEKLYTDIPLTMMKRFDADSSILKRRILPSGTLPIHSIGDDDGNNLDCKEGTFNCMVKIDENLDKRY